MKPVPSNSSQPLPNAQIQGKTTHQSRILHLPRPHKNNARTNGVSDTLNTADGDQESAGTRVSLPRYHDHDIQDLRPAGSAKGLEPTYAVIKVYVKKSRRKIYKA